MQNPRVLVVGVDALGVIESANNFADNFSIIFSFNVKPNRHNNTK
jgi:hypothetical protein